MATEVLALAFDGSLDVIVHFLEQVNGQSTVAPNELAMDDRGIWYRETEGGANYIAFVPWSNVAGVYQNLGV